MKVIVSGGGTGGHVYPAIAVIQKLRELDHGIDVLYVGSKNSLEEKVARQYNVHFLAIEVQTLKGKGMKGRLDALVDFVQSVLAMLKLLHQDKPNYVLGMGSFVSVPILTAAVLLRRKIFLHTQNVYPGVANRFFARFADKIFISFPESIDYFKTDKAKFKITGNPIREIFNESSRTEIRHQIGLEDKKIILSYSGSDGSESFNQLALGASNVLNDREDVVWIHVTGKMYFAQHKEEYKEIEHLRVYDYLNSLPEYMIAADIVISRSGSSTLTELSSAGVASILIPVPDGSDDHQYRNARYYEQAGAAFLVKDEQTTHTYTYKLINELLDNDELREGMAQRVRNLGLMGASSLIAQYILIGQE